MQKKISIRSKNRSPRKQEAFQNASLRIFGSQHFWVFFEWGPVRNNCLQSEIFSKSRNRKEQKKKKKGRIVRNKWGFIIAAAASSLFTGYYVVVPYHSEPAIEMYPSEATSWITSYHHGQEIYCQYFYIQRGKAVCSHMVLFFF